MCIIDSALKFRTFQRPQEYYYRHIRSTYICETLEPVKHIPHTYYLYNWSPVENRKGSIRSLLSVRLSVCLSVRNSLSQEPLNFFLLKICMELDIHNIRTATGPFFYFCSQVRVRPTFSREKNVTLYIDFGIFRLFG